MKKLITPVTFESYLKVAAPSGGVVEAVTRHMRGCLRCKLGVASDLCPISGKCHQMNFSAAENMPPNHEHHEQQDHI